MSDLKYQGLLERVAKLTARYEDEIADLRVELTNMSRELDETKNKVDMLNGMLEEAGEDVQEETLFDNEED